jgi:hypothetical protein
MPVITALNKIDMISRKEELISKIAALSEQYDFEAIVPVSAKTGEGIEALLSELKKHAENSPHFFPDDTLTDQPERVLAAEMIREKMLRLLDKEIPHGVAVSIELMRERDTSDIMDVEATIYCERESHKGITAGIGEARGIHLILSMAAGDTIHGDIIHGDITHGTAHSTAVGDTRTMDITDITITAGDTLTTATAITGEVDTTVLFTKIAITQCLTPPTEG